MKNPNAIILCIQGEKTGLLTADRFAQLVGCQTTVREVVGSNTSRTNTQGL